MEGFNKLTECNEMSGKIKALKSLIRAAQVRRENLIRELKNTSGLSTEQIITFIDDDPDHSKITQYQDNIIQAWITNRDSKSSTQSLKSLNQKRLNLTPSTVSQSQTTTNNVAQSQMSTTSTPANLSQIESKHSDSVCKRKFSDSDDSIIFESQINTENLDLKKVKIEPSEEDEDVSDFLNKYDKQNSAKSDSQSEKL